MWTDSYGGLHLQDTTDLSHSITVNARHRRWTAESTIGPYLEITFDDIGHTTWNLTGGLTLTGDNSGDNLYGHRLRRHDHRRHRRRHYLR